MGHVTKLMLLVFFACFVFTGCEQDDPCPDGTRHCPCYNNNTCDDGLVCEDSICVFLLPDGDDETAVDGDDETDVDGDDEAAVDGDDEAAVDGDDEAAVDGDNETDVDGDDEAAVDGDDEAAVDGDDETAVDGDDETAVDGDDEAAVDGDNETAVDGDDETAVDGDDETDVDGDNETDVDGDDEAEVDDSLVCSGSCLSSANAKCMSESEICLCYGGSWLEYNCEDICSMSGRYSIGCGPHELTGVASCMCQDYSTDGDEEIELDGEDETAVDGDDETAVDGDDETAIDGDDETAVDGDDETAIDGDDETAVDGDGEAEVDDSLVCNGSCLSSANAKCMSESEICLCYGGSWLEYNCEAICSMSGRYSTGCGPHELTGIASCMCQEPSVDGDEELELDNEDETAVDGDDEVIIDGDEEMELDDEDEDDADEGIIVCNGYCDNSFEEACSGQNSICMCDVDTHQLVDVNCNDACIELGYTGSQECVNDDSESNSDFCICYNRECEKDDDCKLKGKDLCVDVGSNATCVNECAMNTCSDTVGCMDTGMGEGCGICWDVDNVAGCEVDGSACGENSICTNVCGVFSTSPLCMETCLAAPNTCAADETCMPLQNEASGVIETGYCIAWSDLNCTTCGEQGIDPSADGDSEIDDDEDIEGVFVCNGSCSNSDDSMCMNNDDICFCFEGSWIEYNCEAVCSSSGMAYVGCGYNELNGTNSCLCQDSSVDGDEEMDADWDFDVCDPNPCTEIHKTVCNNLGSTYTCECNDGYEDNGDGECVLETTTEMKICHTITNAWEQMCVSINGVTLQADAGTCGDCESVPVGINVPFNISDCEGNVLVFDVFDSIQQNMHYIWAAYDKDGTAQVSFITVHTSDYTCSDIIYDDVVSILSSKKGTIMPSYPVERE